MDESIARLNIEHYQRLLDSQDLDDAKRRTVQRLLAEEQAKLEKIKREKTRVQTH